MLPGVGRSTARTSGHRSGLGWLLGSCIHTHLLNGLKSRCYCFLTDVRTAHVGLELIEELVYGLRRRIGGAARVSIGHGFLVFVHAFTR